jgi:Deltamethrin resistance
MQLNLKKIVFLAVMRGSVRNYGGQNLKKSTMNDMPVPEGCFKMLHAARQRGHNTMLAAGIGSLTFAIFLVRATGTPCFHYDPPTTYE